MKRNWNRTLAIFLSVCMLLSLFPAAGAVELEGETETAGVEADADRELISDEGSPDPEPAESEDETETSDIPVTEEDESQTEPLPPDEDEEEGDIPAEEEPPAEMEPVPEEPSDESDSILNEEPPAEDAFYFEDAAPAEYDAKPAVTRSGWYQDSATVKGEGAVCEDTEDDIHLKAETGSGNARGSDPSGWPTVFVNDDISEVLAEAGKTRYIEMTFTPRSASDQPFGVFINYSDPGNGFVVSYDWSGGWYWQPCNTKIYPNEPWYTGTRIPGPNADTEVTLHLEWNDTYLTKATVDGVDLFGGEPVDISSCTGPDFGIRCGNSAEVIIHHFDYDVIDDTESLEPDGKCGPNAFYKLTSDGVLHIWGTGDTDHWGSSNTNLDALTNAPWGEVQEQITSVIIEEGITGIGRNAFTGCQNITSIQLPNSVTRITDRAFYQCKSLTSIQLPENLTYIPDSCFAGSGLTSFVVPSSVTDIGSSAFDGCHALERVTIPEGVTALGNNSTFRNCSSLKEIDLPDSLTTIGFSKTFEGCTSLERIKLPANLTDIKQYMFTNCKSLKSIEIPESVTNVKGNAFRGCTSLTSVTIPAKVNQLGLYLFISTNLKCIVLMGAPSQVDDSAFYNPPVEQVYVASDASYNAVSTQLNKLDAKTAYQVANLNGGTMAGEFVSGKLAPASKDGYDFQGWQTDGAILEKDAGGYTPIPADTARGTVYTAQWVEKTPEPDYDGECGKVPGTVFYKITDGELHIWGDGEMKDYTTNSNDRDNRAPWSGEMISSVVIDEGVTTIGVSAFSTYATSSADGIGTALTSVKLPSTLTKISNNAFLGCKLLTRVDIPEGVTAVGDKAFYLCNSLAYVTFPDSLRSIGSFGFADCWALTSAELPAVETLGLSAFGLCKNLSHVDLGNSLRTIGNGAFSGCPKLTSITFPDTLKSIGSRGFEGNALTSVVIPDGVELDWMAFSNISALQNIVLLGTPNANSDKQPFSWTSTAAGPVIFYANGSAAIEKLKNGFGYFVHPKQRYFADTDGGILAAEVVASKLAPLEKDGATFYGWMDSNGKVLTKGEDGYYAIPANTAKGTVYTAQWQEPTHEHNWSEWSVTTPVTCLTDGKESRTCGICDEVETRDIPTNGHSWSEWSVTTPAACLTAGEESRSCGVCGETETRSIPANGHSWSAWRVTTPATCVSGVESRTCACGAVETRVLPAVNEHTWDNGTVTLAPTYTMEGERTFTCTVCHGTRTESIPVRTRPSTGGSSSGSGGSSSGGSTTPPPVVIEDLDTPLADLPFTDLTTGAWYEDAITYVYSKKLMDGSNDASFSPDAMMIRGEMAQILYNLSALAGEPAAGSASCVFADVAGTNPNAAAILWAASHELVLGYGNGNFGPQDNISREQMALMLFRYAKFYGLELTWDEQVLEKFSDNAEISSWAREAMAWAVGRELIVGYGDDRVDPSGLTTRAQTASTIMRFHQMLEENSAG